MARFVSICFTGAWVGLFGAMKSQPQPPLEAFNVPDLVYT